jgi:predicted MFS family arabinose efflux permease
MSPVEAYRDVLRLPGVAALTAVAFLARIPATASAITLTLHVVLTLDHGYGSAGLVGAAATVGMAIGAPLLGRLVDRRGLRPMVAFTTAAEAVFWSIAPGLPFAGLLVGAFLGGLLGLPVYSVVRQSLASMVAPEQRRPAFALDSMSVELSFIVGPAAGTVIALSVSTGAAMWAVGAGWVASGVALWLLDPPTRTAAPPGDARAAPLRSWFGLRMAAALLATTAAVTVLFGTELSMIAGLEKTGQAAALPLVNAVWCLSSLAGGFAYGAARRPVPLVGLVATLGATALIVGAAGPWWSYLFLLVPTGLLCAPSLAASSEAVTALAPEHSHGSSITVGAALTTPLAGLLIDIGSPAVAVLAVGAAGIAGAGVAGWLWWLGGRVPSSAASQPL